MSEQIMVEADIFYGLEIRNTQLHSMLRTAKQERDLALARVKELEKQVEPLSTDVQRGFTTEDLLNIVEARDGALLHMNALTQERDIAFARIAELLDRVDSLASDVQCARLASDLASKEREALRQLVQEYWKSCYVLHLTGDTRCTCDLCTRAAALLGTEEPK